MKAAADWSEYKSTQHQVYDSLFAFITTNTNIINSSSKLNSNKPFWHYIKSRKQEYVGISALQTPNGTAIATTSLNKAEVLNNTFKLVFTKEDLSSLPVLPDSTYVSELCKK